MKIGIDLGGTKIEGIILNSDGKIQHKIRLDTPVGNYVEVVESIGRITEELQGDINQMDVSFTKGKKAITKYKTLKVFEGKNIPTLSLVECKLETGRTHQIRFHCYDAGHPIVGDEKYSFKESF